MSFPRILLCTIFLGLVPSTFASEDCSKIFRDLLNDSSGKEEELIKNLEDTVLQLSDRPLKSEFSSDQIKQLKENGDLFKILKQLASKFNRSGGTFGFWLPLDGLLLTDDVIQSNSGAVKRIHHAYRMFVDDPIFEKLNLYALLLATKKKDSGALAAKKKILGILERLSYFYSGVLGRQLDFSNPDDILAYFSIDNRIKLGARIQELDVDNQRRVPIVMGIIDSETNGNESVNRVYSKIRYQLFGDKNPRIRYRETEFISNRLDAQYTRELISLMGLSEDELSRYLKMIETIHVSDFFEKERKGLSFAMMIMHAYQKVHGKDQAFIKGIIESNSIKDGHILTIKSKVMNEIKVREIIEARFSDFVEFSEQLKARARDLEGKLEEAKSHGSEIETELDAIAEAIPKNNLDDTTTDLEAFDNELRALELRLDTIIERVVAKKRLEDISSFSELNFRWDRVIPNQAYEIPGIDYSTVRFTEDVVKFFQKDPRLGGRFMATLTKGYVPIKKNSGLRRLPDIHKQFRDIKIIRSHGKIRMVGKLIDDHIHFFYVYDSEEAYKNRQMAALVENFNP